MWTKNDNIPEGYGTIDDIIVRAEEKYSEKERQAEYIKIAVSLIRRDLGEDVKIANFVDCGYDGVLTLFASGGDVYAHWELYENGGLAASGVEKYSPTTNTFKLLFSSSPVEFNRLILPRIMSTNK